MSLRIAEPDADTDSPQASEVGSATPEFSPIFALFYQPQFPTPFSCLDWSPFDPNVLVLTSSEESLVSIYDFRSKKISMTLTTQTGCTQARWDV